MRPRFSILACGLLCAVAVQGRAPIPYTRDAFSVVERRPDGLVIECDAGRPAPWGSESEPTVVVAIPDGTPTVPLLLSAEAVAYERGGFRALTSGMVEISSASRAKLQDLLRIRTLDIMRDLRLATVVMSPTQASVFPGAARCCYRRVRFLLPYDRTAEHPPPPESPRDCDFRALFNAFVLNAFDRPLLHVGASTQPASPATLPIPAPVAAGAQKALVAQPGLCSVTVKQVSAALSIGTAVDRVSVESSDGPVPAWLVRHLPEDGVRCKTEGALDAEDRIIWYAERSTSPYSRSVAYWLRTSESGTALPGLTSTVKVAGRSAAPTVPLVLHLEKDLLFLDQHGKADHRQAAWWVWVALRHPTALPAWTRGDVEATPELTVSFTVPHVDSAHREARLRLRLIDDTGEPLLGMHDVTLSVNGRVWEREKVVPVGVGREKLWETLVPVPVNATLTLGMAFRDVSVVPDPPVVALDWLELRYVGRLDARQGGPTTLLACAEAAGPVEIHHATSATLVAVRDGKAVQLYATSPAGICAVDLPASTVEICLLPADQIPEPVVLPPLTGVAEMVWPADGADYLIVTHPAFAEAVGPLAALYEEQGLRAHTVTTEVVYDVFGQGVTDPMALRTFLQFALDRWKPPAPTFVLLVGDASWDYWQRFSPSVPTYVPSYRVEAEAGGLFYPSDNWYACLRGEGPLPDVHLGRLPVQSATVARTLVNKAIRWTREPELGPWRSRFLFLTDDGFEQYADSLIEHKVPAYMEFSEIRFEDFPFIDNVYLPSRYVETEWQQRRELVKASPVLTEHLLDTISRGVLFVEYFGHGSPNVLGHERVLFGGGSKFSDVPRLRNGARLPFLVAWTCETAYFDFAEPKWNISIGEDLLAHENGGVLLVYGASGRGYSDQHVYLASGLHEALDRRLRNAGDLVSASKLVCAALSRYEEPLWMFLLLGDPGITLPVPRRPAECTVIPGVVDGDRGATLRLDIPAFYISPERGSLHIVAEDHRGEAFFAQEFPGRLLNQSLSLTVGAPAGLAAGPGRAIVYALASPSGLGARELFASGGFEIRYNDPPAPAGALPNLRLATDTVRLVNRDILYDGMTALVEATVANDGTATAHDVLVELELAERSEQPMPRPKMIPRLAPGQTRTVRLRYDSYGLCATRTFIVTVDPKRAIPETSEEDNRVSLSAYYRSKPDLDLAADDLIIGATDNGLVLYIRLRNVGEAPAQGIFYHTIGTTAISVGIDLLRPGTGWESLEPSPAYRAVVPPGGVFEQPERGIRLPADTQRLRVTLDDAQYVDERNRANNSVEVDIAELVRKPEGGSRDE